MPGDDFIPWPTHVQSPTADDIFSSPKVKRAQVEEVDDDDAPMVGQYTEEYPGQVEDALGKDKTKFEKIHDDQSMEGMKPHAPFTDEEEWESVKWLMKNVGQTKADNFLKLPIVSDSFLNCNYMISTVLLQTKNQLNLSMHNNSSLLEKVDTLATGPRWTCKIVTAHGNKVGQDKTMMTEDLELWKCDPVECIKELIMNPEFQNLVSYVPQWAYADKAGLNCIFDEMWTVNWWLDTQV